MVFFTLILQDPNYHQNLISSLLYHPGLLHKFSLQSVHNLLSNVAHLQTHRQTDKPMLLKTTITAAVSNCVHLQHQRLALTQYDLVKVQPQLNSPQSNIPPTVWLSASINS